MTAHRYWQITGFVVGSGDYVSFAECYLRATRGGSNQIPSAFDESSSYSAPTYDASKVYDADPSTFYLSDGSTAAAQFLSFDYGSAVTVEELYLQAPPAGQIANRCPTSLVVKYCSTSITGPWTTFGTALFDPGWSLGDVQYYEFGPPPGSGHLFWKFGELYAGASPPGNGLSAAEWHLRATIGGSDQVPNASGASTQGFGAVHLAYDNNAATLWGSNSGDTASTAFVCFGYASPFNLAEFWLQARADSGFQQQTPYQGNIYYSDGGLGGPWTLFQAFVVPAFTTVGQIQTYDVVSGDTVGMHATKGVILAVCRTTTAGLHATKGEALAVYNKPSIAIEANMARVLAPIRETAQIEVNMGKVLAVVGGRIAHPAISPWTFQLDGHSFVLWQMQDQTLVYDRAMENWMVWGTGDFPLLNAQLGQNWLANVAGITVEIGGGSFNVARVVCGDGASNGLYFLDPDLNEDYSPTGEPGKAFKRIITGQLTHRGNDWVSLDEVQVLASDGETVTASDLSVLLSYSDDRGHNYQDCETIDVTIGDHSAQLQWSSLGSYTQPGRLLRLTDYGALKRVDDWATPDDE